MVWKKRKRPDIHARHIFWFECMNEKRKKIEKPKKFENSYMDIVIFCFAILAYYFLLFCILQKYSFMYFFVKKA